MRLLTTFVFVLCCQASGAQAKLDLNSFVKEAFNSFDSVVVGTKAQSSLTTEQSSFLYIIADWTNSKVAFDHNNGFKLTKDEISRWRRWYRKNCERIDQGEFYKAIEIYRRVFTGEIASEEQMDFLDGLKKKYSSL